MKTNPFQKWCIVAFASVAIAGCSQKSGLDVQPVHGQVTRNGQPLAGAVVEFYPSQGRPSNGTTDDSGNYQMRFTREEMGALSGIHTVKFFVTPDADKLRISTKGMSAEDADATMARAMEPCELKHTQQVTVEAGDNRFDFDLTGLE
ncbi:hypothetical protein AB1L30_06230 [Bremerella sp. JC817]|uniref:hypothetical protein n=1 Tax=Bremerella sp. JC817 TaxID=3231756 RepID=UPI00345B2144